MAINNDLSPVVPEGIEKELMLLLDTTGSMNESCSEMSRIPRRELVGEALAALLDARQKAADPQAISAHDQEGGLVTVTFAEGETRSIIPLSSTNFREKYDEIRWQGGTEIMPGWDTLIDTYAAKFSNRPADKRPALLALVITDGVARDIEPFARALRSTGLGTYVVTALVGHGAEHEAARNSWEQVAKENDHVRVVAFTGQTDPQVIANSLLALVK